MLKKLTKTYTLPKPIVEAIDRLAEATLSSKTKVIVDAVRQYEVIVFGKGNDNENN